MAEQWVFHSTARETSAAGDSEWYLDYTWRNFTQFNLDTRSYQKVCAKPLNNIFRELGIRKNFYLLALITVQSVVISTLYLVIRGKFGRTLSPIQPDSLLYICKGLKSSNLSPAVVDSFLSMINKYFDISTGSNLECGTAPGSYSGRVVLPTLIGIFAKTGVWWSVFLPSIIISLLVVITWWFLTKEWVSTHGISGLLVGLLPWLSPHIGFYVSLVLTEGPLILLILILLLELKRVQTDPKFWFTIPPTIIAGLYVRQSWPIFALILGAGVSSFAKSKLTRFGFYSLSFMSVAIFSLTIPQLNDTQINFFNVKVGFTGLIKGVSHDFWHLFQFGDLPALTLLLLLLFKRPVLHSGLQRLTVLGLFLFSCFTCYSVYLGDGSYGQNWRYFAPTFLVTLAFYLPPPERKSQKMQASTPN